MPAYPRTLQFLSDGALLSLTGEKRLGFMARGVPGAHAEIARLLPNQLQHRTRAAAVARPNFGIKYFDRMVERESWISPCRPMIWPKPCQRGTQPLPSPRWPARNFRTQVSPQMTRHREHSSTTAAPGLSVVAMYPASTLLHDGSHDVYVQSIGNGSPVADAQVDIIGRNGLPVSSGRTTALKPLMNCAEKTPLIRHTRY